MATQGDYRYTSKEGARATLQMLMEGNYAGPVSLLGASRHNEVRDGNNNPGPTENRVIGNSAHGNGAYDGFDRNVNPRCDGNVWEDNDFGSVNQHCVSGRLAPADGSRPDER